MAFCTVCGTAVAPVDKFCTHCGAMRPDKAAGQASPAGDTRPPAAATSPQEVPGQSEQPDIPLEDDTDRFASLGKLDDTRGSPPPAGTRGGAPFQPGLAPAGWPPAPQPAQTHNGPWAASRSLAPRTRKIVAIVVVLLLAGGGTTAWVVSHTQPAASQATPSPAPKTTSTAPPPRPQAPASSLTPSAAPTTSPPSAPSTSPPTALSPEAVQLTEGAASAQAPAVLNVLQRYFDATNAHNYPAWRTAVTTELAASQNQSSWEQGYRSTHDSSIVITAIKPYGSDGAVAAVSFTSTQSPTDAPPDLPVGRICWQTQLPITNLSGGGQVGSPPG